LTALRLFEFLRGSFSAAGGDEATVEYRLVCSGVLYNSRVLIADWTRSDACRILSPSSFKLIVASSQIDEYPQELALSFRCPVVRESYKQQTGIVDQFMFRPDGEIIAGLASLLTVFTRRLITVRTKVREMYEGSASDVAAEFRDMPIPIGDRLGTYWPPRPASVITTPVSTDKGWDVRTDVHSHMPDPVPFDPGNLKSFLSWVAHQPDDVAEAFLGASRLYQKALAMMLEDADVAYLMLTMALDTLAGTVLKGYTPDPIEIERRRQDLAGVLRKMNLSNEQISEAIFTAAKDNPWSTEKFVTFVKKYLPPATLSSPDPLYPGLGFDWLNPSPDDLEGALRQVYRQRSAASHGGRGYPAYVTLGTSASITYDAIRSMHAEWAKKKLPPITWFERVVQASLMGLFASSDVAE